MEPDSKGRARETPQPSARAVTGVRLHGVPNPLPPRQRPCTVINCVPRQLENGSPGTHPLDLRQGATRLPDESFLQSGVIRRDASSWTYGEKRPVIPVLPRTSPTSAWHSGLQSLSSIH